jgi:prophage endopeptidase
MILHLFNLIGARWGVAAAWRTLVAGFPLAALLLGAAAGAWGGWSMGRAPLQVALSELRTERATQAAADAQAALQRLQEAQARGDALTAALEATRTQNNRLSQEKTRAFQNQSTGRACLSLDALRVLNDAPGLSVAGLPAPTSSAAAASEPVATDTDLGTWAIAAGAQYQACSNQLSALIDWHGPSTSVDSSNPTAPKDSP